MSAPAKRKPRKQKNFGSAVSPSGTVKPCPTCYAPMLKTGSAWTCTNHGAPRKP